MRKIMKDADRWNDRWYRALSSEHKIFWDYICDHANNAGVWKLDFEKFYLDTRIQPNQEELLKEMNKGKERIIVLEPNEYWLLTGLYKFRFGNHKKDGVLVNIVKNFRSNKFFDQIKLYLPDLSWAYDIIDYKNKKGGSTPPPHGPSTDPATTLDPSPHPPKNKRKNKSNNGVLGEINTEGGNSKEWWNCLDCTDKGIVFYVPKDNLTEIANHLASHGKDTTQKFFSEADRLVLEDVLFKDFGYSKNSKDFAMKMGALWIASEHQPNPFEFALGILKSEALARGIQISA